MRKAEIDDLLGTMLEAHDLVSDLNVTVDRPLQVEASGELVAVPVDPPLENLTPFQTVIVRDESGSTIATGSVSGD